MLLRIKNISLASLIALSACGFQPVHGDSSHILGSRIDTISVGEVVPDEADSLREAQLLKGYLEDDLRHGETLKNVQYRLDVKFNKVKEPQDIRINRDVTRYKMTLEGRYKLTELASGKIVANGTSRETDSFDAPSAFATYTVQEDTIRRILKETSRDIIQRILISLSKVKKGEKLEEVQEQPEIKRKKHKSQLN